LEVKNPIWVQGEDVTIINEEVLAVAMGFLPVLNLRTIGLQDFYFAKIRYSRMLRIWAMQKMNRIRIVGVI